MSTLTPFPSKRILKGENENSDSSGFRSRYLSPGSPMDVPAFQTMENMYPGRAIPVFMLPISSVMRSMLQ